MGPRSKRSKKRKGGLNTRVQFSNSPSRVSLLTNLSLYWPFAICDNHLHLEKRDKSATLHAVPPLQGFYWPFYIYIHCILYIIQAQKSPSLSHIQYIWSSYLTLSKNYFFGHFWPSSAQIQLCGSLVWFYLMSWHSPWKVVFLWKLAIPCPSWKWAVWSLKQTSQNQFLSTFWQEF